MKKLVLGVAIASLVISCKKVAEGSNKGVIKLEEGTERYTDDVIHGDGMPAEDHKAEVKYSAKATEHKEVEVKKDSAKKETKPAVENHEK